MAVGRKSSRGDLRHPLAAHCHSKPNAGDGPNSLVYTDLNERALGAESVPGNSPADDVTGSVYNS